MGLTMRASRLTRIVIGVAVLSLTAATCGGGGGGSAITVAAFDSGFRQTDLTADAGEVDVVYVNEGATLHRFLFDGLEDDLELEISRRGDRDTGAIRLEPGPYTYYCDVSGHRAAGMEGTLTVS